MAQPPQLLIDPATGQTVLDRMKVLFPELQIAPGGKDVTTALTAANMAQDYMESVFAQHPEIYGDTTGTVTAYQGEETTPMPQGLLRLDALYLLDDATSRPTAPLDIIRETGAHAGRASWLFVAASTTSGRPWRVYTNGRSLFWAPCPDRDYQLRWYGLQQQAAITPVNLIMYPDVCLTPLANFAVQMIRTGLDDDASGYAALATTVFGPVVTALTNFRRDRPTPFQYRYSHDT